MPTYELMVKLGQHLCEMADECKAKGFFILAEHYEQQAVDMAIALVEDEL